ncbi:hypothetical protein C1646_755949 [Rhizophagus diaphanus]|nr:hypothetical protein C1646_755949 [Rhizophagus diaphanus] [Rhizophagus sp. MUCL 43196]
MTGQYKVLNPNATQQEIDDYVQKRHEYIKNIENTVAELTALSRDLHLHDQTDQTIINNEQNVQDAEINLACVLL